MRLVLRWTCGTYGDQEHYVVPFVWNSIKSLAARIEKDMAAHLAWKVTYPGYDYNLLEVERNKIYSDWAALEPKMIEDIHGHILYMALMINGETISDVEILPLNVWFAQ